MTGSVRQTLLTIAALVALLCGAAIAALLVLSRMASVERADHARDNVTREVRALRSVLETEPLAARPRDSRVSGSLLSGYAEDARAPGVPPFADEALAEASSTATLVVLARSDAESPVLVAAMPVPGGGYAFAFQRVVAGRETRGLRVVVLALALLSSLLVVAALRTMRAAERGVSSLRGSLAALASDLHAPVPRPALRELHAVADGVAALAGELVQAQTEHDRLTRELADRERLAALGRVAAGVAHEVRNPLAAMKLRADLARTGGEATPAVARDLEDIASEIARLDRLVSDLLVVAGRRAATAREIDLGELVAKRAALLAPWAEERGVRFAMTGAARASADADALARALDNLLRNAVEASPKGALVEVRVSRRDGGGASVAVVDSGTGVPAEREAELFEPFFTTKPDGTGLGLALARAVATAHGGTVTYAREGGRTRMEMGIG